MAELAQMIERAHSRLTGKVLKTPLYHSGPLSRIVKNQDNGSGGVWLKLESEQYTGSFKARGALNKVLASVEGQGNEEKKKLFVTASTGNHGRGFARAVELANRKGIVVLPEDVDQGKLSMLRNEINEDNVELRLEGKGCLEAELSAKSLAESSEDFIWVSPYNDPEVLAGQGTIGVEIHQELPQVDVVFGCVGGGGMMSGISEWLRHSSKSSNRQKQIQIIGCLPENSPEMYLSVQEGRIVDLPDDQPSQPTLADGSAGGIEPDSITFDICRRNIDEYILVSEAEIKNAIQYMLSTHSKLIEGAAGVALAAFLKSVDRFRGKNVVVVICGANISRQKLLSVLT